MPLRDADDARSPSCPRELLWPRVFIVRITSKPRAAAPSRRPAAAAGVPPGRSARNASVAAPLLRFAPTMVPYCRLRSIGTMLSSRAWLRRPAAGEHSPSPRKPINGTARMRLRSPSSRATPQIRFLVYDVVVAALAPLLTLWVRDAYVLSYDGALTAGIYCLVSLAFSLIAFAAFGIRDGMPRYFSVHDAIDLAKAVVVGGLMTTV